MPTITVKSMVKALKKVPEKKFRIAEIAPELMGKDGKVDIGKAVDRLPEINMAIAEVQTYVKGTKMVTEALSHIGGSPFNGVNAPFNQDAAEAAELDELEAEEEDE